MILVPATSHVTVCLVGCDEESSTPVGLRQPPHDDVTGFDDKTSGTMHVWHPPPHKTVLSGCKGGLVAKEFVSFGRRDGTSAPWDMGATATDFCSNSRHPLFPQVDPLTFDNLAKRTCTRQQQLCSQQDGCHNYTSWHNYDYGTPGRVSFAVLVHATSGKPLLHSLPQGCVSICAEEEEEASLGGHIISPRNADRWRQALAKKMSLLDVAQLRNARYHGGTKGYEPLTMSIVHHCEYTEIN